VSIIAFVYRNKVTNIRYQVYINDQLTFPGNDPGPSVEDLFNVLLYASLVLTPYEGPAPMKEWQLFPLTINGEITIDQAEPLMTALKQVWYSDVPGTLADTPPYSAF
jgi:hypothetical protein